MKKLTLIFITALTFSAAPVFAISTKDLACGAIMCLSDDGGSACSPYLDKYFSIKKKKHGSFCSPCTKIARKAFLQQCDYVEAPIINQVNNQYGGKRQQYNGFDWSNLTPEQREALERFLRNGRF